MNEVLLEIKNLKRYFSTSNRVLHAVDDVSFHLEKGKTLGVVGESGCGKSTTSYAILRLHEPTNGEAILEGRDITKFSSQEMWGLRSDIQIIFQDPLASLNPRKTVSETIAEPLRFHKVYKSKQDQGKRVLGLMELMSLSERPTDTYPHEPDDGQRQHIGIARALAMNPKFIVCDKPVSALDVSIQAQILNLLKKPQKELGLTYIFITHDLSVVNYFSDEIMAIYLRKVVEHAPTEQLFAHPIHPYTKVLLSTVPVPRLGAKEDGILLKGEITSPIGPKPGCQFTPQREYAKDCCFLEPLELQETGNGHFVPCCFSKDFQETL